jgi:hypothetical protein
VTGVDEEKEMQSTLSRCSRDLVHEAKLSGLDLQPTFTANELYDHMLNPTVDSKTQIEKTRELKSHPKGCFYLLVCYPSFS